MANFMLVNSMIEKNADQKLSVTAESLTSNITNTANITIRNYLRSISDLNFQFVIQQYQRFQRGEVSESIAKKAVKKHLESQVIGQTGYPYVVDSSGVIQIHPKPELINVSLEQHAFIQEQLNRREGYLEYEWKNPGESRARSKALHMIYFEPWDWIITSSSYREEFIALINIADFNELISSMRLDESGYIYVVNGAGDFIVHPFFEGNFYDKQDSEGKLFVQDIINGKNGKTYYTWKNPDDTVFREKVAVFRHIPEFDWYVVASAYLDELYLPAQEMSVIHGIALIFSILVVIPSTIILSSSIIQPLKKVMAQVQIASSGNYSTRIEGSENSNDELAQLSRHFNHFMNELEDSNVKLHAEIEERIEAQKAQSGLNSKLEQMNKTLEATVSERTKELEQSLYVLKKTQDQLIESEKLSALGGLVAGVAHEINTPLGISVTATSVIEDVNTKLRNDFQQQVLTTENFSEYIDQQLEAIRLVNENLGRAAQLVQNFKQTAADQVSECKSNFAVITVLEALIASLHPELIKVPVNPRLKGDASIRMVSFPGVLTQVVSNLLLNSITHAFEQTDAPKIDIDVVSEGENILIIYRDNGCGVPEEWNKKIFEPFFTTRKGSNSTGLGLNLVFNLVTQKLRGKLDFKSAEGVEFKLILPAQVELEERDD